MNWYNWRYKIMDWWGHGIVCSITYLYSKWVCIFYTVDVINGDVNFHLNVQWQCVHERSEVQTLVLYWWLKYIGSSLIVILCFLIMWLPFVSSLIGNFSSSFKITDVRVAVAFHYNLYYFPYIKVTSSYSIIVVI